MSAAPRKGHPHWKPRQESPTGQQNWAVNWASVRKPSSLSALYPTSLSRHLSWHRELEEQLFTQLLCSMTRILKVKLPPFIVCSLTGSQTIHSLQAVISQISLPWSKPVFQWKHITLLKAMHKVFCKDSRMPTNLYLKWFQKMDNFYSPNVQKFVWIT